MAGSSSRPSPEGPRPARSARWRVKTLAKDLSAHLVFGTVSDAALRILTRGD